MIEALTIGDALRIDVEGCPPRVLNDLRFARHAQIVDIRTIDGAKYVTIGWPDGWQVGVSMDVAVRMREAARQHEPTMTIAEALEKEKDIFQDLERRREESRQRESLLSDNPTYEELYNIYQVAQEIVETAEHPPLTSNWATDRLKSALNSVEAIQDERK